MKFHTYTTQPEQGRRAAVAQGHSAKKVKRLVSDNGLYGLHVYQTGILNGRKPASQDVTTIPWLWSETEWIRQGRPFYNVWPAVLEPLQRLDLSAIPVEMLKPPIKSLLLRFSEGNPMTEGKLQARSAIVAVTDNSDNPIFTEEFLQDARKLIDGNPAACFGYRSFQLPRSISMNLTAADRAAIIVLDTGEMTEDGRPMRSVDYSPLFSGKTIGECLKLADAQTKQTAALPGEPYPASLMSRVMSIYATLCLLDEDSELLDRIVLSADKELMRRTLDPEKQAQIIQRALRQGVNGWDVGRRIEEEIQQGEREQGPHFRRPHFAIRWMGKKPNLEPKIRPVRGTLVNRDKVTQIPTGFVEEADSADTSHETE